ncbi:hypothetical protein N7509_008519 [Penicillium cosmopolitanum]|uniref:N-acetyltransferase domain-containing protein n=1 Tax=Penicillium cosmopolitanum TaxID=1131564 RepID=A0A9W9VMQ7_9EURO|nr:uncharacterized protein N7509_008519 [Penicillium cosmopolitanum]KAJ5385978.1 hypothetical protein N7509_008519 [Penicillium cosmopolitanum]
MSFTSPMVSIAPRTWKRDNSKFFISTDQSLLSIKAVNEAYGREFLYWAKPFDEDVLRQMLYGCMSFGVYQQIPTAQSQDDLEPPSAENTEQIGLARMITDGVTFGYLTDVYVLPEYQGHGLGRWLIECVSEVFSKENMPHLRRNMLLTSDDRMQEFYADIFDTMKVVGREERKDIGKDLVFMCARPVAKPDPSTALE